MAFKGQPEASRIEPLTGDSATFDFGPYLGKMDAIFIDASHSYSYVKADTEAALKMLSPQGTILWHDYPAYPGIFAYLNELGAALDRKIYHILGTGLAFSSRGSLVVGADEVHKVTSRGILCAVSEIPLLLFSCTPSNSSYRLRALGEELRIERSRLFS